MDHQQAGESLAKRLGCSYFRFDSEADEFLGKTGSFVFFDGQEKIAMIPVVFAERMFEVLSKLKNYSVDVKEVLDLVKENSKRHEEERKLLTELLARKSAELELFKLDAIEIDEKIDVGIDLENLSYKGDTNASPS